MACFQDLAFIPAIASECLPEHNETVQTVLFSICAIVLLSSLPFSLIGAWQTKNKKARYHLLTFSLPTLYAAIISILVAAGVKTGEDGVAIVVLFGFYVTTFVVILYIVGSRALRHLAEISLQGIHSDQKNLIQVSPKMRKMEIIAGWAVCGLSLVSFVCLTILFPLAPAEAVPYWMPNASYHQRAFYWDLGIVLSFIFSASGIMIMCFVNLYLTINSLETALKNYNALMGSPKPVHSQEGGNSANSGGDGASSSATTKKKGGRTMESVIFKLKLGMWGIIPGAGCSIVMGVVMLLVTGIGPRYYLVFAYLMSTIVFAQYWTVFMFQPHDTCHLRSKIRLGGGGGTGSAPSQSREARSPAAAAAAAARASTLKSNNDHTAPSVDTALVAASPQVTPDF